MDALCQRQERLARFIAERSELWIRSALADGSTGELHVCFGDGQTEAICGRTGKAEGRLGEGRRAGKGKKGNKVYRHGECLKAYTVAW